MNYDPISYLGLSCPSGGEFYICQDSEIRFLGCCDIDPCGSNGGECPSSAVRPSSFDAERYDEIPAQSCAPSTQHPLWYTCTNGSTFLGCCASNPCNNDGVCPKNNLAGAVLNNDPSKESVFLTTSATVTSTSTSPTHSGVSAPTSTTILVTPNSSLISSPTTGPAPSPVPGKTSSAPTGSIVGGILGGISVLGLVAFAFFLYRRRRRRALPIAQLDEDAMATSPPPWSPYHDSFRSRPAVPPASVSPLSTVSTPRSISASLGSIIRFKRPGARKRWSFHISAGRETIDADWARAARDNGYASQGFPSPATELDSSPPGRTLVPGPIHTGGYYEVEGSIPDVRPKEMAS
ncbi:hypothetical protein F4824DRAFT_503133 [Ustulina deusta]|nr:hypothetical protein F4824DRAFT_503133 [Ustulina deusta]